MVLLPTPSDAVCVLQVIYFLPVVRNARFRKLARRSGLVSWLLWHVRDLDICEFILANGLDRVDINSDGECGDAGADEGVLEQVWPSCADQRGRVRILVVVGRVSVVGRHLGELCIVGLAQVGLRRESDDLQRCQRIPDRRLPVIRYPIINQS